MMHDISIMFILCMDRGMTQGARQVPMVSEGATAAVYAFVQIDNCEAKTRPTEPSAAAAGVGDVLWNQKMAFPSCR